MAYQDMDSSARKNHQEFVKINASARKQRLNYGQHVGLGYLGTQLTIKEKLNMMRETGNYNLEKVGDRKESPRKTKEKQMIEEGEGNAERE